MSTQTIQTIRNELLHKYNHVVISPKQTLHVTWLSCSKYNTEQSYLYPKLSEPYDYFIRISIENRLPSVISRTEFHVCLKYLNSRWCYVESQFWKNLDTYISTPDHKTLFTYYRKIKNDCLTYFDLYMESPTRIKQFLRVIQEEYMAKLYEPSRLLRLEAVYGDAVWGEIEV
jgi:hypothetical protein